MTTVMSKELRIDSFDSRSSKKLKDLIISSWGVITLSVSKCQSFFETETVCSVVVEEITLTTNSHPVGVFVSCSIIIFDMG